MIGRDPGRSRMTRPGGGEDLTALTDADKEAFTDPLYKEQGEMVLDDWQLTVLIAVVLDPTAPPVDPNAPAATTPERRDAAAATADRVKRLRRTGRLRAERPPRPVSPRR